MKELQFSVSGMKCQGCISAANQAVADIPGIVTATFDLSTGAAVVTGDVDPQAVVDALTAAGYPTQLVSP